jgi:hypothetical protein
VFDKSGATSEDRLMAEAKAAASAADQVESIGDAHGQVEEIKKRDEEHIRVESLELRRKSY